MQGRSSVHIYMLKYTCTVGISIGFSSWNIKKKQKKNMKTPH